MKSLYGTTLVWYSQLCVGVKNRHSEKFIIIFWIESNKDRFVKNGFGHRNLQGWNFGGWSLMCHKFLSRNRTMWTKMGFNYYVLNNIFEMRKLMFRITFFKPGSNLLWKSKHRILESWLAEKGYRHTRI